MPIVLWEVPGVVDLGKTDISGPCMPSLFFRTLSCDHGEPVLLLPNHCLVQELISIIYHCIPLALGNGVNTKQRQYDITVGNRHVGSSSLPTAAVFRGPRTFLCLSTAITVENKFSFGDPASCGHGHMRTLTSRGVTKMKGVCYASEGSHIGRRRMERGSRGKTLI
jgi:hypothetical protein